MNTKTTILLFVLAAFTVNSAYAQETELPVISIQTFEGINDDLKLTNTNAVFDENYRILINTKVTNSSLDKEFEDIKIQLGFYQNGNQVATSTHIIPSKITFNETVDFEHLTGGHSSITEVIISVLSFTEVTVEPTVSITLQDIAGADMVNLIGDNFGSDKEIIIKVTNPAGTEIADMSQRTTSEGRINVLFLLEETPMNGTYTVYLTNHSFETTLSLEFTEALELEVTDTVTVGNPEEVLSPETQTVIDESNTTPTSTPSSTALTTTDRAIIISVLNAVIDLLQGLVLALS